MRRKILPLLLIFGVVLILFHPILSVYFSQDDFFHFKVAQTDGSLKEFIDFFKFRPFEQREIAFYRPIFREILYNVFYSLFGLSHLPFRIFAFLIHFLNITFVYLLMERLFNKKVVSFLAAFFFGITAANVGILYYLAGGIQAQGATMFMLLSLLFFHQYLQEKEIKYNIFSFISFLLALASHEMAVVTPFLLSGLVFVCSRRFKFKDYLQLLPLFLLLLLYLYLNISVIGFSEKEIQYQPVFNPKTTINTLAWYSAWSLGLPEMTVDFVRPGLTLNPSLMKYWGDYFSIIFPAFFVSILILVSLIIYLVSRKPQIFKNKIFWLLAVWFPASLLPVLFLPFHKKTYYLAAGLPAFWGLIGYLVYRSKTKPLILFTAVLVVLNIASIKLGEETYWAANRGRIAERLINQVKTKYPKLPKGAAIYFKNDPDYPFVAEDWGGTSQQASVALSGSDALQLFYHDSQLEVFYQDLGGVPEDYSQAEIFTLVAKLQ